LNSAAEYGVLFGRLKAHSSRWRGHRILRGRAVLIQTKQTGVWSWLPGEANLAPAGAW